MGRVPISKKKKVEDKERKKRHREKRTRVLAHVFTIGRRGQRATTFVSFVLPITNSCCGLDKENLVRKSSMAVSLCCSSKRQNKNALFAASSICDNAGYTEHARRNNHPISQNDHLILTGRLALKGFARSGSTEW